MKSESHQSELRALQSIRNFKNALEMHYAQMLQIEKNMVTLNRNAWAIIEAHSSKEAQKNWENNLKKIDESLYELNQTLNAIKEKVQVKDRTDTLVLWSKFDSSLNNLNASTKLSEKIGFEILPTEEHTHWQKDICIFEETILPLITSHAEACKIELKMIEKYTPKQLDKITQIIFEHIPENFTYEEAHKYEKEYLIAFEDLKKEFNGEKNFWDKFLDILAGGTHQPPSERVMLERWIEGEKNELV